MASATSSGERLMSNEKNVQALTAAIRKAWAAQAGDWARHHNAGGTNPEPLPSLTLDFRRLAADLAAEGVLITRALTDDELLACEVDQESRETPLDRGEVAALVRERLERVARGEP
jgi:hypothetical protein